MHSNWHRAVLVSLLMIFSSLAGCLESESEDDSTDLGTIMVSTYHVEQIVSAIVGDAATVEIMSPSNVPVHDYEPSAADLIKLQQSEMFFYHGLGLEPWVEATLSSFGENSIDSYQTHAMPTGEVAVDYETLLIENLCKILSGTDLEMNNLSMEESDAKDAYLHAENVKHSLSFPEMHDDHDEDGHDEDGHDEDGHDEEGHHDDDHDDHSEHDDHKHLESEEALNVSTTEGCPSDYVISIFNLEAGEYILEFEEADVETFDMAILKMGGGHAHHDHGDEHGDEHGVCHDMSDHTNNDIDNEADCEAGGFIWMEEENHSEDGDYCHDTKTHQNTNHTSEHDCEEAGHMWMEGDGHGDHDDEITAIGAMKMGDTNNDGNMSWDEIWTLLSSDDDHDEDGHDEDEHDEEMEMMMPYLMAMFNESDADNNTLLNMNELENFVETMESLEDGDMSAEIMIQIFDTDGDGGLSFEEYMSMFMATGDGDDHDEDGHDEDGHDEDGHDDDDDDLVTPEELLEDADTDNSGTMTLDEFNAAFGGEEIDVNDPEFAEIFDNNDADTSGDLDVNELEGFITEIDAYLEGGHSDDHDDDEHDDDGHDEDGHDEDGHDEDGTDMEDLMEMMMQLMFEEMDANNDSILDAEELASMMSMGDDENHAAYASLHVKEEGEYGFALPPGVTMHILANDGHDDHGHGSHDGHSDENVCYDMTKHTVDTSITTEQECVDAGLMWTASNSGPESDDDHDEDGHDEDGHDEEELNLDPHSWLSPLAFKQQVSNVLDILVEKYPDMESKFTDNANAYMAKLDSLHSDFEMTFSNSSTCESNTVVANHNAYNYIGVKYNIEFVTVHGLDPEGEPSAQDVAEVVEEIKENDIKVLFIEEYTDPTAVDGIVQETGVTLQYLYTMELPPSDSDDDYLSLMNKNLNNLKSGLACTN